MNETELLIDLHRHLARQGPGGDEQTRRAIRLAGLKPDPHLAIADIGCGSGSSALLLARELEARVTAIDFAPAFIDRLKSAAERDGLAERITPRMASMEQLAFHDESLDVIWSEGAIYNIGFREGIRQWRRFLKPGGVLVVSEISWTSDQRPREIETFWQAAYPQIGTMAEKTAQLEAAGYDVTGRFLLPPECWLDNYYRPLQSGFSDFLERHAHGKAAQAVVDAMAEEILIYEQFGDAYSYGMYVARK